VDRDLLVSTSRSQKQPLSTTAEPIRQDATGATVLVHVYALAMIHGCPFPPARSRKVCMTCHWFRHHAGVNCIPVLTCQLHQGLIAHGEHLTSRCQGWTDDLVRQKGWAPEVA
jgi:hypothetical protein